MKTFPGGPRTRVAFLLVIALGVFFLPAWWTVAIAAVAMAALWLGFGLGGGALARQLRKLAPLSALIVVGYALFALDPATDRWVTLELHWWQLELNTAGALEGATMALRVFTVVAASHVARAGDPRALASGLRGLGLPRMVAAAIDATLALLGTGGRGRGGGRGTGGGGGGGGGRHRDAGEAPAAGGLGTASARRERRGITQEPAAPASPAADNEGFWASVRRIGRGDVGALTGALRRHIGRVEQHLAERDPDLSPEDGRDVAVIAGVALTMLGIKLLKLLPGLPFAPGHKGVLLIPLYLVAAQMTRSRAGATWTGLTMGTVAFLLGDGRYGVFEIAKHVAPGVLVDLLLLPTRGLARGGRTRALIAWSTLGLLAALGRYATITVIALAVQPPAIVYAVLLPGLIVHAIFGVLSGLVSTPLLAALDKEEPPR